MIKLPQHREGYVAEKIAWAVFLFQLFILYSCLYSFASSVAIQTTYFAHVRLYGLTKDLVILIIIPWMAQKGILHEMDAKSYKVLEQKGGVFPTPIVTYTGANGRISPFLTRAGRESRIL